MRSEATAGRTPFLLGVGWLLGTLFWWVLAFVHLPAATPEWVVRARAVCFRTLENGLPDSTGWGLLILAPAGLLTVLLVVWWDDLGAAFRSLWRRSGGRALLGLLALLPLILGVWVGERVREGLAVVQAWQPTEAGPMPESYPRLDQPAPPFRLIDGEGRTVTLESLGAEVIFLTFAFGHCETVCPVTVQSVVQGAERLGPGARVAVITLDPWRDTPAALAHMAHHWSLPPGTVLLSGEVGQVNDVLDRYQVPRQRDPDTGAIAHPPLVYVIDGRGRITYALNGPSPEWVVEAGRRALSAAGG